MQSTTPLNLNLQSPNHATTMHAVQNDRLARKVIATLYDGSAAWTPPSGTSGIVRFVKPDGTMGFYDKDEKNNTAVTWTGNIATIILAEQMLTVPGDVYCQVNFYNAGEERLSTFNWLIKVQKNVITDETIESTDYFNILTEEIAAILDALAEVPVPTTTTPKMDGTAAVGSETKYARGDHRHPTDTSRAPIDSPTFTGTPKAVTTATTDNSTKIATTAYVKSNIAALSLGNVSQLNYVEVTS